MDHTEAVSAFTEAAARLRRRAERHANGLDVLVWSPRNSPGGGQRLLLSLLPGMAADPRVRSLRLAVPPRAFGPAAREVLREAGVAVVDLRPDRAAGAPLVQEHGRGLSVEGPAEWVDATVAELVARADVVYAYWAHGSTPPRGLDVPVVATVQDTTLIDFGDALGGAGAAAERDRTARWLAEVDALVVSSQATKANLRRLFGDAADDVRVVHHAIRPSFGPPPAALPADLAARLPSRYVIYAGNVSHHKNVDVLLRAWSAWDKRAEWPLLTIGYASEILDLTVPFASENPRFVELRALALASGLRADDGLVSLGFVPDDAVSPLVAGAAALAMPSMTEGGGSFPVEEALAAGVPVLCADIPVMREHLSYRSADAGWFDPHDPASVVRAADELVRDYPARLAQSRAGATDPRPAWTDVAGAYVDVFAEVVASRSTASHSLAT